MGNQSVKAPESEAEELSYLTNLQISQIDKLYERYKLQLTYQGFANSLFFFRFLKLGGDKGHLTRDDLRNCGLESNPLGDRLIGIRSWHCSEVWTVESSVTVRPSDPD